MSMFRELKREGLRVDPRTVFVDASTPDVWEMVEFGNETANPPFSHAWVESRSDGIAMHVVERTLESYGPNHGWDPRTKRALSMAVFVEPRPGMVIYVGYIDIPLDENGCRILRPGADAIHWRGAIRRVTPFECKVSNSGNIKSADDFLAFVTTAAGHVLRVYSLLNCKNIAAEPTVHSHRDTVRCRRSTKVGLTWHRLVVVVPALKAKVGAVVPYGSGEAMTRAHLVRGHFKNFDGDSKLFGKYTGRFWWSPMTRGDKSIGVVLKDYEVRTA